MSSAPIQFRLVEQGDGSGPDQLQWRHRFNTGSLYPGDGIAGAEWSPWEKVERWGFVQAYEADAAEHRELQLRQARAIFGLTPQPAEPDALR